MQTAKALSTWVQIVTGVAVVVGLVLVIVELRQVQTLSRAQLSSDAMIQRTNIQMALAGENAAAALAKACIDPESLRPDEMRTLDAYLYARYLSILRMGLLTYRDGLYTEKYLQLTAAGTIRETILDTAYGRAWFKVFLDGNSEHERTPISGFIQEIGEKALNQAEPVDCRASFNKRVRAMQGFLEPPAAN